MEESSNHDAGLHVRGKNTEQKKVLIGKTWNQGRRGESPVRGGRVDQKKKTSDQKRLHRKERITDNWAKKREGTRNGYTTSRGQNKEKKATV